MKKIRYLPFGYTIRNGQTVIDQQEAETVRGIFTAYIHGASLKEIAEDLTAKNIPYTERSCVWDKARISRKQVFPVQLMMAESCLFSDFQKIAWNLCFGLPGEPADVMIERDCPAVGRSLPYCGHSDAEP